MLGFELSAPRKREQIPSTIDGVSSDFGKNVVLSFEIVPKVFLYVFFSECAMACGRKARSVG